MVQYVVESVYIYRVKFSCCSPGYVPLCCAGLSLSSPLVCTTCQISATKSIVARLTFNITVCQHAANVAELVFGFFFLIFGRKYGAFEANCIQQLN